MEAWKHGHHKVGPQLPGERDRLGRCGGLSQFRQSRFSGASCIFMKEPTEHAQLRTIG